MANKVICSTNKNFPSVPERFPLRAACAIGQGSLEGGKVPVIGYIDIPAFEEDPSVVVTIQGTETVVPKGQEWEVELSDTEGSICFVVTAECKTETVCVTLPAKTDCQVTLLLDDPCNCLKTVVVNNELYFYETINVSLANEVPVLELDYVLDILDSSSILDQFLNPVVSLDQLPIIRVSKGEYVIRFYHKIGDGFDFNISFQDANFSISNSCNQSCNCSSFALAPISNVQVCNTAENIQVPVEILNGEFATVDIIQVSTGATLLSISGLFTGSDIIVPYNVAGGGSDIVVRAKSTAGSAGIECRDEVRFRVTVVGLPNCNGLCGSITNACGESICGSNVVVEDPGFPTAPGACNGQYGIVEVSKTVITREFNNSGHLCSTIADLVIGEINCGSAPAPTSTIAATPTATPTTPPATPTATPTTPPATPTATPTTPPATPTATPTSPNDCNIIGCPEGCNCNSQTGNCEGFC